MPNHVINVLHLKDIGNKKELFQEEDDQTIDFNKIKPMPESLNISDGSITYEAVAAYLISIAKGINYDIFHVNWNKNPQLLINVPADIVERIETMKYPIKYWDDEGKKEIKDERELALLGKQYIDNIFLYGAPTWYGWSCNNWGTKWNAYEGYIIDDDEIEFQTAWSPAEGIGIELSNQNPNELVSITYANEDPSSTGYMEFYNGNIICDEEYEYGTQYSVDTYRELWGYSYLEDDDWNERAFSPLAFSYEEAA